MFDIPLICNLIFYTARANINFFLRHVPKLKSILLYISIIYTIFFIIACHDMQSAWITFWILEDPRERHLVCKLDRYQLEDKYLRLLDEMSNLKKLSNCQEDKIKRLGTKLIRLAGSPRLCGLTLDIVNDRNRMAALELENTKVN